MRCFFVFVSEFGNGCYVYVSLKGIMSLEGIVCLLYGFYELLKSVCWLVEVYGWFVIILNEWDMSCGFKGKVLLFLLCFVCFILGLVVFFSNGDFSFMVIWCLCEEIGIW